LNWIGLDWIGLVEMSFASAVELQHTEMGSDGGIATYVLDRILSSRARVWAV
jgi:hypothetical protein